MASSTSSSSTRRAASGSSAARSPSSLPAQVYRNFPGAASGGTPELVDLAGDPSWLSQSAGNTRLSGNNAHAYVDADSIDGNGPTAAITRSRRAAATGSTRSCRSASPARPVPAPGCTWNSTARRRRTTNRRQAATQLFYLVNAFHDHLRDPPIGFTPRGPQLRADRFRRLRPRRGRRSGHGGDGQLLQPGSARGHEHEQREHDHAARRQLPAHADVPLHGPVAERQRRGRRRLPRVHARAHEPLRRQRGRPRRRAVERHGRGLERLVRARLPRDPGPAARHRGQRRDDARCLSRAPAAFARQGADCPVGAAAPACPGTGPGNRGGYTLGDLGSVEPSGFEVHADGEIWLETLWDLRDQLGVGDRRTARHGRPAPVAEQPVDPRGARRDPARRPERRRRRLRGAVERLRGARHGLQRRDDEQRGDDRDRGVRPSAAAGARVDDGQRSRPRRATATTCPSRARRSASASGCATRSRRPRRGSAAC